MKAHNLTQWSRHEVLAGLRHGGTGAPPCTIDGWPRFGEFYDLTEWLTEREIPWDRFRNPLDRGTPEITYYRPGDGGHEQKLTRPAILTDGKVREVVTRSALATLCDQYSVTSSTFIQVHSAVNRLTMTGRIPLAVVKYEPPQQIICGGCADQLGEEEVVTEREDDGAPMCESCAEEQSI